MNGMIVAPQPAAVEAGARVLMAGGNAVDAAITCAFVQGVVDPHNTSIGGYVVANLHLADGTNVFMDAPALAGSKVTPDMWQDRVIGKFPTNWGYILRDYVNIMGYTSICTPGTVKAFAALLERYGTISWEQAIAPAVQVAEEGFPVSRFLAWGWRRRGKSVEEVTGLDYLHATPEARRVFLKPDGTPYDEAETFRNPDYASTLRHLARHGAQDFYTGELGARISADLEANGSFVTAQDLADYQLRDVPAVEGTYRGYRITSSVAPHGGPTLIEILNILEGYDLSRMEHNSPEYIYLVSMAMKAAFTDRDQHLGDLPFTDPADLSLLINKERAALWRDRISRNEPITGAAAPDSHTHTTQVCVVDSAGNSISLTHSLGSSSGVVTPGLGFMYNNSMINFEPQPNKPNSIAPRKGRATGMSPTIVYKDDQPVLIVGAPGGNFIITGVLQVILNVLDFGMSAQEAVTAPRFDCEGGAIRVGARIPDYVCNEIRARHPVEKSAVSYGDVGLVQAIIRDPATGKLTGGSDPGAGGMALRV
jgi:gamma-glutamyltranspeptidase/glutathione hydrolase